jgi:VanZ family protein
MLRFIPAVSWLAFITYLFLLPGAELPKETWFEKVYLDKWVHTGFFCVLIYLFYIPLRNKTRGRLLKLVFFGLLYGITIEFLQRFYTADRSFDLADILFDSIGCTIAWFICGRPLKK